MLKFLVFFLMTLCSLGCAKITSLGSFQESAANLGKVSLQIQGIQNNDLISVTVQNEQHEIVSIKQIQGGSLAQVSLNLPQGNYKVTVEGEGYRPATTNQIITNKKGGGTVKVLEVEQVTSAEYSYHWESDLQGRQYEYSVGGGPPQVTEFLDEQISYSQTSAASEVLLQEYKLILSNDGDKAWSSALANRLLKNVYAIPKINIPKTKVILTNKYLEDDILINEATNVITLSTPVFNYAEPRMVKLNARLGSFFSRRLFKALVHFYTKKGRDTNAVNKIFIEKFGLIVQTNPSTTENLTGEHWDKFQDFRPHELLDIIMALSETPKGFFKIQGLRYLLRRRDGQPHPVLKEALAVAHPRGPNVNSYIEFMEIAFSDRRTSSAIHKTILHEKTHFLWTNVFSSDLKNAWVDVGGWYENANDPSGWSSTSTTHFVTPYAHLLNPNEDMAESLSFYILNPKKLYSVAPEKYKFIEQNIMNGYKYTTKIRQDLEFEVLNLFPDYIYPGKIKRVDVSVTGHKSEDKTVTVELQLQEIEGFQTAANHAYMRLLSSQGTFKDLYLYPVNSNSHILRGEFTLSNLAKKGYWITQQIVVTDSALNTRTEGVNDYGLKIFLNNEEEDTLAPQYIKKSMSLSSELATREGHSVFKVTAQWDIQEDHILKDGGVYASLAFQGTDSETYSLKKWGKVNKATNQATVEFYVNEYFPSGQYGISYVKMIDRALNSGDEYFSKSPTDEVITTINLNPSNRDSKAPELDLNAINISSLPANSNNLNGDTLVTLRVRVKDNKSGVGRISFYLQDPIGRRHHYYFYHTNTYTLFYQGGNPTAWKVLETTIVLPAGSATGTWGLYELYIEDKGGNFRTYNFTETVHFELATSD